VNVKVLGAGCPDCTRLGALVEEVANEAGLELALEKVVTAAALRAYGLSRGPGLVVDGEVKAKGRVPSKAEVAQWLRPGPGGALVALGKRRRFVVLGICSLSLFMVQLDSRITWARWPPVQPGELRHELPGPRHK
jgi:hypothetical protein